MSIPSATSHIHFPQHPGGGCLPSDLEDALVRLVRHTVALIKLCNEHVTGQPLKEAAMEVVISTKEVHAAHQRCTSRLEMIGHHTVAAGTPASM